MELNPADFPAPLDPKRTIKATISEEKVQTFEKIDPGVIFKNYHEGYLAFSCPGCGRIGSIKVGKTKPIDSPSWEIKGSIDDLDNLTTHPSINCVGCCGWHGFLRKGIFESC